MIQTASTRIQQDHLPHRPIEIVSGIQPGAAYSFCIKVLIFYCVCLLNFF